MTTNDDWNSKIKNNPAPWAEVEVPGKYILTVPSKNLRSINDIVAVGVLYEEIMNSAMKLAGLEKRFRTERVVFDGQISAGMRHFFHYIINEKIGIIGKIFITTNYS